MKRFPLLLGMLFITVTIRRVAHFAGGDALAWTFSIALAMSVYISAYLTGWATTRRIAWVSLIFFASVDGFFNLAETLNWSVATGRWSTSVILWGQQQLFIYRFADVLYGAFPTLAAAMLGWLAMYSEKLIARSGGGLLKRALHSLESWLLADSSDGVTEDSAAKSEPEPAIAPLHCDICGATAGKSGKPFLTPSAIAGHKRWEHSHQNGKEPAIEEMSEIH